MYYLKYLKFLFSTGIMKLMKIFFYFFPSFSWESNTVIDVWNLFFEPGLVSGLKSGDDIGTSIANIKDDNGRTVLHFGAAGGKTHICKYLIEELKLDVDIKDDQGVSGLLR